jgi:hypothetical protein
MFTHKKGQSLSTGFIYAVVSMFGLAILYFVVIEYALIGNFLPMMQQTIDGSHGISLSTADHDEIIAKWDYIKFVLRLVPFILFWVIVIFMFILGIRKESEQQYFG